jgi:hypothetical protein
MGNTIFAIRDSPVARRIDRNPKKGEFFFARFAVPFASFAVKILTALEDSDRNVR